MSNNFKYTLEKNKQKIILGASIVGFIGVSFGVFSMINSNKNIEKPQDEVYVDTENIRAEYIIGGNEAGQIDLIKVDTNEVIKSITLDNANKTIYSRGNDLEKVLSYTNGVFYEIEEKDGELESKELLKIDNTQDIKEFKFSDDYIVANTGDSLLIFNIKDGVNSKIEIKDVDSFIIVDNTLVYGETEYLHLYNLETKENKKIEIGDKTQSLFELNGKVIAFNEFGSGNNKSTILQLKTSDLYIEKAHRHDNENLIPITPDSDDKDIVYIDKSSKLINSNTYYKLNLNGAKEEKKRVQLDTLNAEDETEFTEENTVSTKGYLYTNKSGKIEIFRLNGEVVDTTLDTDKTFFMPISEENLNEN